MTTVTKYRDENKLKEQDRRQKIRERQASTPGTFLYEKVSKSPRYAESIRKRAEEAGRTFDPTVISDTTIRDEVIPDLNRRASLLYGKPPVAPALPTGKPVTTTDTSPKAPTTKQVSGISNLYEELSDIMGTEVKPTEANPLDVEYEKWREDIFKMQEKEVQESAQKALGRVSDAYNRRRRDIGILQEQAGAQNAQLRGSLFASGASRYGSVGGGQLVTSTERNLLNQLSDLQADEQEAIEDVREAQKQGEWRVMEARLNYAEKVRAEKEKRRDELNEEIRKRNEEIAKRRIEVERDLAVARVLPMLDQGFSEGDLLTALNEAGLDITADELVKTAENLTGAKEKDAVELLTGLEKNFYALKNIPGALPKSITSLPEDQQLFAYLNQRQDQMRDPRAERVGTGTGSVDDYEQYSKEQIALSVLPTQLKNGAVELNRALAGIRAGLATGKTPYEIADALTGYKVENPTAFSEGLRKYASLANLESNEYAELGRLVNAGEKTKAIALIENKIYYKIQSQQGEKYVSEADVSYVIDKVAEIDKLLGEGWMDEVGAFTGNFNNFIQRKFGGFFGGEAPAIKAKITSLTADLINKRAGSALTDTEWKRLVAANVPAMNESGKTVRTKMQELIDNPMTMLNAERAQFELPALDRKSLRDRSLRVPLYSSPSFETPVEPDRNIDAKTRVIEAGKANPSIKEKVQQILSENPVITYDDLLLILGL